MTPRAFEYRTAVVHTLRDARDELGRDELGREDFAKLLEFLTATLARFVSEAWEFDPDRPEGWS